MIYYITHYDYIGAIQNFLDMMSLEVLLYALVAYFFFMWIAIVVWVSKDIRNRTHNWLYQIFCIFLVIFWTPLGVFFYLMFRPGKTLLEQEYEEYEEDEQDQQDFQTVSSQLSCFSCHKEIDARFKFCPHCCVELKHNCKWCGEEVLSHWKICPYCWISQEKVEENVWDNTEQEKIWEQIHTQETSLDQPNLETQDVIHVSIEREKPPLDDELIATENFFQKEETK